VPGLSRLRGVSTKESRFRFPGRSDDPESGGLVVSGVDSADDI